MSEANCPAYPTDSVSYAQGFSGLTKREYIAALVMQGLLANASGVEGIDAGGYPEVAVRVADALLAELAKPKEKP